MRQNNITKWKYDSSLNCLLFFAQRLDELLFHHTTDTYRYPSLSLRGLAAEYCSVYSDVRTGTVNKKNLEHIIEELSGRLDHDDIAKNILTEEFSSRFIKSHKSWDIKTQFENAFFRHDPNQMRTYGQVIDAQNQITTISPKKLLKNRVSTLSRESSTKNAESLIKVLFKNLENLSSFSGITRIHNSAILSENTSDSLLSLWSILESIVDKDNDTDEKQIDKGNEDKKDRSKIGNVISYTIPYLKSTHIQKLVQTCMTDIIRWDIDFFNNHIANNGFGSNDLEHTFAFLAFKSTQPDRDCLFASTETYPLLRYRVCTLSDSLQNSKEIKSLIKAHTQRVTWHLHRIYRARNYIIHDANSNNRLNEGLVINLHSYVDTLFSEVITHISISPYNDSIYDAITNHKLSVLIMDEKLENRKNEEITVDNALQYLYYDFER